MDSTKRIIINTAAQYIKAVFNTILSLYSTRLILDALTVSDYGIYTVVGGVVAMLGFITNALIVTTQRFISFYNGKENQSLIATYFSNSLFLHVIIGILLCVILLFLQNWLINDILTIPTDRIAIAHDVYTITAFMLFLTIMTAPFKALFIARESIVFIVVIEMADAIIKLLLAIGLYYVQSDKLLFYTILMGSIVLLNFLVFAFCAQFRFKECQMMIRKKDIDINIIKQLLGFAGWSTYGMGAIATRNQGTAIVLNHFFGTSINAAYGIAFQVNGAVAFIVTSILNAMNPQIMKSEGGSDRKNMMRLASLQSKYSVIILSIVTIPLIIEMPSVLDAWLKEVPPYTSMFCQFVLAGFICDQFTMGLQSANQAIGNIRNYTLFIYTPKLVYLPIIWIMLSHQLSIDSIMWLFIIIELGVAMGRIVYTRHRTQFDAYHYIRTVIAPWLSIAIIMVLLGLIMVKWISIPYRFFFTFILLASSGVISTYFFAMGENERNNVKQFLKMK